MISTLENSRGAETFFLKRKVSNRILFLLLEMTNVKKIILSRGVAAALPKNSIDAIARTGVRVRVLERVKRGRKRKYDVKRLEKMLAKGKTGMKKISEREKIPLRTLYYYKNKFSERARK